MQSLQHNKVIIGNWENSNQNNATQPLVHLVQYASTRAIIQRANKKGQIILRPAAKPHRCLLFPQGTGRSLPGLRWSCSLRKLSAQLGSP